MENNSTHSPNKIPKSNVKIAAGGIVRRRITHRLKIAVIHRTRYGSEWCLPKGKPEPAKNETFEQTAIREVKEETGCEVEIVNFAGTTDYLVKGTPKIVLFWNMKIVGRCNFKTSEEVDQVVWLSPREAINRLSHDEEKKLISKVFFGNPHQLLLRRFYLNKSYRHRRLAGSLKAYRSEMDHRICRAKIDGQNEDSCWAEAADMLLTKAELALKDNKMDEGWRCFHAAQRMEIFGLTKEELEAKAIILRHESEKLSSWRKNGTDELIGKADQPKFKINHEQVYQAALLRDENYNNQAYKDNLLRTHVGTLVFLLLFTVFLFLIGIVLTDWIPLKENSTSELGVLSGVVVFGLLGGTFSAALKVPQSVKSSRIPELVHTIRLTLLRVFMGITSAIIIYIFSRSQFAAGIFNFNFSDIQPYTYYAVSFVAGFSERLVLRAVKFVEAEKK